MKIKNHFILSDLWSSLDYAFLTIEIFINKNFIQDKWWTIIKNSKEEENFVNEFNNAISNIDISDISNKESLKEIAQKYTTTLDSLWHKYSKSINITKCSKA